MESNNQPVCDTNVLVDSMTRRLALLLRHGIDGLRLEIDTQGWASMEAVAYCLNSPLFTSRSWFPTKLGTLEQLLQWEPNRDRFEYRSGMVRARYGHSLPHVVTGIECAPPQHLLHVSSRAFLDQIRNAGLLPGTRNYVHLTTSQAYARSLFENTEQPIELRIASERASRSGIRFRKASAHVWLTSSISAEFIQFQQQPLNEEKGGNA